MSSRPEIRDAKAYGKVALLMGGWSAEREISLKGGGAVLSALKNSGVDVHAIDVNRDVVSVLKAGNYDRVFNMLHGRGGEDGVIQAVLDLLQLPYTGSGLLGSAIAMDKVRTKYLWKGAGLPTPEFLIVNSESDCELVSAKLGLPVVVKPVLEGSSIGIAKVKSENELIPAWRQANKYGPVMIEEWITGGEYTVGILDQEALPIIRLQTKREFYDYQAKYIDDDTQYHCPCGLPGDKEVEFRSLAMTAFEAAGVRGWGRVDFMLDNKNQPWLIEVNTIPGMTDHSLVPMAAKVAGINFDELVMRILETSMVNREVDNVA